MGIAVIIPNVSFQDANLGKVTLQQGVPLRSMTIVGPDEITEPTLFAVNFFPANTSQRGIVWSIVSGGTYASINSETDEVTPIVGAVANAVVIRATSAADNTIYAEKTISVSYGMVYEEKYALVGDGTARINTGYFAKKNSKIIVDYTVNSLPTATSTAKYFYIWGQYRGEEYPTTRHMLVHVSTSNATKQTVRFGSIDTTSESGVSANAKTQLTTGTRYKQELSREGFLTNRGADLFTENNYGDFNAQVERPIHIFAGGSLAAYEGLNMNLYGFEVQENGNPAMRLVPCTLLSDIPGTAAWDGNAHLAGENGLWDKVGQKFYGNSHADGLGTFSTIG